MVFVFFILLVVISTLISHYYMNNIIKLTENKKNNNNVTSVLKCISNVYKNNYSSIHKINLININDLKYRLENTYYKINQDNNFIYNKYLKDGLNIKDLPSKEEKLYNFLNSIRECTTNHKYTLYFKNVAYYNNGIITVPVLNMELYNGTINKTYDTINNNLFKLKKYGNINIKKNLEERFNILKDIMNELSNAFANYGLGNVENKEENMFSVFNGTITDTKDNLDNSGDMPSYYIKSNGGMNEFIQSNGRVFLDTYNNYCFNKNNDLNYNCSGFDKDGNPVTVNTTFELNSESYTDNFCYNLNNQLKNDQIYYFKSLNPIKYDESSNKYILTYSTNNMDFKNNIGKKHVFTFCYYKNPEINNDVENYLKKITGIDNTEVIKNLYYQLYYIKKYEDATTSKPIIIKYDHKNWTDVNEEKTFKLTNGRNGKVISITNNKDFIENKLGIKLDNYINPFFPNEKFNFFINNSGFDLLYKVEGKNSKNIKILRSGNFLKLAIPVTADVSTKIIKNSIAKGTNIKLDKENFLYQKLIEGLIIY